MSECYPKGPVCGLYSFPHKIGADRICMIAWHQVEGVAAADRYVLVYTGLVRSPLHDSVRVQTTLARGRFSRALSSPGPSAKLPGSMKESSLTRFPNSPVISMLSTSALGALQTLRTAARLGIPTVLELDVSGSGHSRLCAPPFGAPPAQALVPLDAAELK